MNEIDQKILQTLVKGGEILFWELAKLIPENPKLIWTRIEAMVQEGRIEQTNSGLANDPFYLSITHLGSLDFSKERETVTDTNLLLNDDQIEKTDPETDSLLTAPVEPSQMEEIIQDGYILLSRKLLDNPIFRDREALQLFLYGLLRANHKPNRIIFNRQEMILNRGQFITGIFELSKATGQTPKQIRNRLALLENAKIWARKRASKFSVITVCNYNYYQNPENYKGQAKGQGEGKQRATDNNVNKEKNIYVEGSEPLRFASFLLREILKNKPDFKKPNLQTWAKQIDLMIRVDKRSPDAIERVIRWSQADHGDGTRWKGWASNILSAVKLREKFDTLEMKMQENSRTQSNW